MANFDPEKRCKFGSTAVILWSPRFFYLKKVTKCEQDPGFTKSQIFFTLKKSPNVIKILSKRFWQISIRKNDANPDPRPLFYEVPAFLAFFKYKNWPDLNLECVYRRGVSLNSILVERTNPSVSLLHD